MDEKNQAAGSAPRQANAVGTPHPELERLLDYFEGRERGERTIPSAEADAIQEHVSLCSDCARLLLEYDRFRADADGAGATDFANAAHTSDATEIGEAGPSEALRQEAWEALAHTLREEGSGGRPDSSFLPMSSSVSSAAANVLRFVRAFETRTVLYALAASLAVAVAGLFSLFTWSQHRHRADLAALEASRRAQVALLSLLRENDVPVTPKVGSPGAPTALTALEVAVGPWPNPSGPGGANLPAPLRAGEVVNRVTPDAAGRLALRLDLAALLRAPSVHLTLLDARGKTLWSAERPSPALAGNQGTATTLKGLPPGRYLLRAAAGGRESVEYRLEVD